mmetsp:Transcript_27239/g.90570  ORF Transcript_27239/g.90570 Transcript_27239/m.90570 type:complete len:302 (+) Transcript_27239:50-955(+)
MPLCVRWLEHRLSIGSVAHRKMAPPRATAVAAACVLLGVVGRPRFFHGGARQSSGCFGTAAQAAVLPLHRLFFINLDRRPARRLRFERRASAQGFGGVLVRFPAVDGRALNVDGYPTSVVSRDGIERARSPPQMVNGVHLTRGALGLILSYHTVLQRIAADTEDSHVYVVAEDDAFLPPDFVGRLGSCLAALGRADPAWEFLHVGYYDDDCSLCALVGEGADVLCRPVEIYGLFGAAIRPPGARALLRHLFPLDEQIDSSLARVYGRVRAYASRPSLMRAIHSTADNSDIQILPPGFSIGS